MDINTLRAINNSIQNAQAIIRLLAWPNFPYGKGEDADLYEMYYKLNTMALTLYRKIDALEAENNENKES